jgi:MoaA/NifB/PqqE/SkfB family radical SAM enzyme
MVSSNQTISVVHDYCRNISAYWVGVPERIQELIAPGGISTPPGLRRLVVVATTDCNLACPFCKVRRNFPPQSLSFDMVKRAVHQAIALGANTVHFTGGECTMVPWIADAVEMVSSAGLRATMSTNGVGGEIAAEQLVASGITKINLSSHALGGEGSGCPEGMELIGSRVTGFAQTLTRLKAARNFRFYLHIVLTNRNFRELPRLITGFLELYALDGVYVIPIRYDAQLRMRREHIAVYHQEVLPSALEALSKPRVSGDSFLLSRKKIHWSL